MVEEQRRDDDERTLVERARTDPQAFDVLYRRYVGRIHGFAFRRSGSRQVAEDVTATTFERAFAALPSFTWRGGGFAPWLFRIASTELVNHYRREARDVRPRAQLGLRALNPPEATDGPDPDDLAAVRAALAALSPRHQQAIELRYFADLSHTEAAQVMELSKSTMAVTLHRALAALRKALVTMDGAP